MKPWSFPLSLLVAVILNPLPGTASDSGVYTAEGFRVPVPETRLIFPRAHGSHPEYKIEWWYLTGHLAGEEDESFGFQATFFRSAAPPDGIRGNTHFGDEQLYMAHMALTDIHSQTFYHEERLNRDGWDARASTEGLDIRNGNWTLRMTDPDTEAMELHFSIHGKTEIALQLLPRKPLIRFGEDGVSRKGEHPHATSYYLSFTRLETTGVLHLGKRSIRVNGTSWMDHEIASRQLSSGLEGWDWSAIHLDDGREIKAYILRREDGSVDPFSRLLWIDREADVQSRGPEHFTWENARWWRSPSSGANYPIEPMIETTDPETGQTVRLRLRPLMDQQEISGAVGGIPYWEGACIVIDEATGEAVGRAYLELAGYAESLGETLR